MIDLPSIELLARWDQAVVNEERQNSHQEMSWVEGWMTVVPMDPALLTELSCKLNLRLTVYISGRQRK